MVAERNFINIKLGFKNLPKKSEATQCFKKLPISSRAEILTSWFKSVIYKTKNVIFGYTTKFKAAWHMTQKSCNNNVILLVHDTLYVFLSS